ncbi:MAG: hypothetical protein ACYC0V_02590 [Armatimonadota bacterium]
MSCIASRLGMNNSEIKEAESAVEKACLSSIGAESNNREDLIIRFDASDLCVTVDITDPVFSAGLDEMLEMSDQNDLVDPIYAIDTIESSTGKFIRIISPRNLKSNPSISCITQLSGFETVSVHG